MADLIPNSWVFLYSFIHRNFGISHDVISLLMMQLCNFSLFESSNLQDKRDQVVFVYEAHQLLRSKLTSLIYY